MTLIRPFTVLALAACSLLAADDAPNMKQNLDRQLSNTEREVVGLVEAMPADKFGFVPSAPGGNFTNVRTFGTQAKHISFIINAVASALLNEKMPPAKDDNGPAEMTKKEDIVKYMKDAFAHGHKAIATINNGNLIEMIKDPFGPGKSTRIDLAETFYWHTYDHYGQMVVYLRSNGVIPPASQPRGK